MSDRSRSSPSLCSAVDRVVQMVEAHPARRKPVFNESHHQYRMENGARVDHGSFLGGHPHSVETRDVGGPKRRRPMDHQPLADRHARGAIRQLHQRTAEVRCTVRGGGALHPSVDSFELTPREEPFELASRDSHRKCVAGVTSPSEEARCAASSSFSQRGAEFGNGARRIDNEYRTVDACAADRQLR
jgi:hypothetical protein